eukprot:COSAG03_NODE_8198_length_827_cov_0.891484_1_plen_41_part_10
MGFARLRKGATVTSYKRLANAQKQHETKNTAFKFRSSSRYQ